MSVAMNNEEDSMYTLYMCEEEEVLVGTLFLNLPILVGTLKLEAFQVSSYYYRRLLCLTE